VKKILIIDNDAGATNLIEVALRKEGYQVISLNDSVQFLDVIVSERPDLILLDHKLPGLDGLSILKALGADRELSSIPVIFFTALGDIKTKTAAFEAGVKDYITRPVHPKELIFRVKNLIG